MMKKTLLTLALCVSALTPALTMVDNASASDSSSIHSPLPQDKMLAPWPKAMQDEAADQA